MDDTILKVVLAAGTSNRYGVRNKILGRIKEKSIIEQILSRLKKISKYSKNIIVISGHNHVNLKYFINKFRVKTIFNKNFKTGLASSVSLVFNINLQNKKGIMFIPGDMPLISEKDYQNLINVFLKNKNKVICPCYFGRRGNPIIIPKIFFGSLKKLTGDKGAKNRLPLNQFKYVQCGFGTIFDVDTKIDLRKAILLNKKIR